MLLSYRLQAEAEDPLASYAVEKGGEAVVMQSNAIWVTGNWAVGIVTGSPTHPGLVADSFAQANCSHN